MEKNAKILIVILLCCVICVSLTFCTKRTVPNNIGFSDILNSESNVKLFLQEDKSSIDKKLGNGEFDELNAAYLYTDNLMVVYDGGKAQGFFLESTSLWSVKYGIIVGDSLRELQSIYGEEEVFQTPAYEVDGKVVLPPRNSVTYSFDADGNLCDLLDAVYYISFYLSDDQSTITSIVLKFEDTD